MRGHLGFVIRPKPFEPVAVVLMSGTSYTVPAGAKTMKAWAVGRGGDCVSNVYDKGANAGGVAYKTWSVTGGDVVSYSFSSGNASVTFNGATITGNRGWNDDESGGGTSNNSGDGGATGGGGESYSGSAWGGGLGGASASVLSYPQGRVPANEVSGLLDAAALAGQKTVEDDGTQAAFGSGGYYRPASYGDAGETLAPGIGGGSAYGSDYGGEAAVVLRFS